MGINAKMVLEDNIVWIVLAILHYKLQNVRKDYLVDASLKLSGNCVEFSNWSKVKSASYLWRGRHLGFLYKLEGYADNA